MDRQTTYKTSDFFSYFLPAIFLCATVLGYYFGLHLIVVSILGLITLATSFNDHLSVIVYPDRFNFCYSNITGRLMAVDNEYYFKDITSFSFQSSQWQASFTQSAIIIFVSVFLPDSFTGLRGKPKTTVIISTKNMLGETKDIKFVFDTNSADVLKALGMIKDRCK